MTQRATQAQQWMALQGVAPLTLVTGDVDVQLPAAVYALLPWRVVLPLVGVEPFSG